MANLLELRNYDEEAQEIGAEYYSALADLVDTSKPTILMLRMLAGEGKDYAEAIVSVIAQHIGMVSA